MGNKLVKLIEPSIVLGRLFVVSKREDDGVKGGHESSLRIGNAGESIAWGVFGVCVTSEDKLVKLVGPRSVVSRSFVVS